MLDFLHRFYSTLIRFWPAEDLARLAVASIGCGEVARGGCLLAWSFIMTRLTVLTEVEREDEIKHDAVVVTRS
jgi:hypothetical protein